MDMNEIEHAMRQIKIEKFTECLNKFIELNGLRANLDIVKEEEDFDFVLNLAGSIYKGFISVEQAKGILKRLARL